jgi:hypothetical protein
MAPLVWVVLALVASGSKKAFGRRQGAHTLLKDQPFGKAAVKDAATAGKSCLVEDQEWSGMNGELVENEKYSGAYLTTTGYFITVDTESIGNLEGGSHAVVAGNTGAFPTSTRDHLDFFVLHLSSYSVRAYMRQWKEVESKWNAVEDEVLIASSASCRDYTRMLNASCTFLQAREKLSEKKTVAIIPYLRGEGIQGASRIPFFEATFWSTWSLFSTVVISICQEKDLEFVSHFPAWKILKFYELYDPDTHYHCELLPGATLKHTQAQLKSKEWDFDYVYYDEADQISLMRAPEQIYAYLDEEPKDKKTRVILPHRHHAQPILSDFETQLQEKIKVPEAIPFAPYDARETMDIETFISGSCCRTTSEEKAGRTKGQLKYANMQMRYAGSFSFSPYGQGRQTCLPDPKRHVCGE